jgi:hypothetical protein
MLTDDLRQTNNVIDVDDNVENNIDINQKPTAQKKFELGVSLNYLKTTQFW